MRAVERDVQRDAKAELIGALVGVALLAAYVVLFAGRRPGQTPGGQQPATVQRSRPRAELIFVEASSGLAQTIALTPFDEALVFHQLDAIVEFLNLRQRATELMQQGIGALTNFGPRAERLRQIATYIVSRDV